jgi:hypothetical protein
MGELALPEAGMRKSLARAGWWVEMVARAQRAKGLTAFPGRWNVDRSLTLDLSPVPRGREREMQGERDRDQDQDREYDRHGTLLIVSRRGLGLMLG